MKEFTFEVDFPGEPGAGLHPFDDVVKVTVRSGDPGGDEGEFQEHMREALAEWYDGAGVEVVE